MARKFVCVTFGDKIFFEIHQIKKKYLYTLFYLKKNSEINYWRHIELKYILIMLIMIMIYYYSLFFFEITLFYLLFNLKKNYWLFDKI